MNNILMPIVGLASVLLLIALTALDFLYYLHIFQLNSYFPDRYLRWKKQNKEMLRKKFPFFFKALYLFLLLGNGLWYFRAGGDLWSVRLAMLCWGTAYLWFRLKTKEKAKKPLVYTQRIYRLYAAKAVIFVVTAAILQVFLPLYLSMAIAGAILIFGSFYVVLLANALLMPLEKHLKRKYYQQARAILEGQPELVKIGITGSYGKTSTKFILENVLKQQYLTLVTPQSYNTTLGVIRTLREHFSGNLEVFVAEMGAKQVGDVKEICDLVEPKIGVITAIGPQHLETFGTIDQVISTKFELARAIGRRGAVIVNLDDANIVLGMQRYPEVNYLTYGESEEAEVRLSDIRVSAKGSSFTVTYRGESRSYQTRLLGKHNISNLAAGIALGLYLGISPERIGVGIRETMPVEHRLELKMQGNYYILDDAFNSNPVGANNALEVLKGFPEGSRFIMTPGMVELGSEDERLHFDFGRHMAHCVDTAILVGEKKTEKIKEGLLAEGFAAEKIFVVKDVFAGFAKTRELMRSGDILLIENDLPDNY